MDSCIYTYVHTRTLCVYTYKTHSYIYIDRQCIERKRLKACERERARAREREKGIPHKFKTSKFGFKHIDL